MEKLTGPEIGSGKAMSIAAPQGTSVHDGFTNSVDPMWLWSTIVSQWPLITLAVAATIIPTAIYISVAKPVYRSTVTIQVNPEAAKVLPYHDVSEPVVSGVPNFDLYMKTQDELLRSKLLHTRVIERLRKAPVIEGRPELAQQLDAEPEIARVEGSQIMKLSYTAADPALAAEVANTWADEFIRLHLELRSQTSKKALEFLQEQLNILKTKVEKAEDELITYARSHQILNIDPKQEDVARQRLTYFNSELARAEKDFIASQAEYEGLKAVTLDEYPESLKDTAITSLEGRAFATEQELTRLLAQFGDKWPAVVQKKQEAALVKTQLAQAKRDVLARVLKRVELKYNTARNEYSMLKRTLGKQTALVNQLNQASVEYNSLKRDLDTSEQLYQGLLQRLKETGVSAGLEFGNIQVADRARPEPEPYRPQRGLSMALATGLGLILGLGLSIGREYLDRTLKDPWQIESLGLPLLGWIPKTSPADFAAVRNGNGQRRLLMPDPEQNDENSRMLTKSALRARESYRTMCASILLSQAGGPPRVLLITSAVPQEGKTTTVSALAMELAHMGVPTLLIDADFRSQAISRSFGFDQSAGLSTYLAGGSLLVEETSIPNLSVMPAGALPPNPIALLNSTRFESALQSLLGKFRFILVDGPPVLSVADSRVLGSKVNGVIFVVKAQSTTKDVVQKAVAQLTRLGAVIIGGTVNQVDLQRPEYASYKRYYYDENYVARRTA